MESPAEHGFSVNTDHLVESMHRAVVLGNPGGGKTTFAGKLAFDLCTGRLFQSRRVTPILVVLRDLGVDQREKNLSIVQFIESRSNSVYQLAPPSFAFEYLLRNGKALVIFDGLDELLETAQREEIRDAVEAFCNLYPAVPVLVTSRQIGYEQAPLDRDRFEVFRLNEFDDDQVTDYVTKWFSVDETLSQTEQETLGAAFLRESETVADLRSNPLMLGLMCSIYREENFIPANRPEVYKKCALMLFERWDRNRRIKTAFTYEDELSPLMAYLAHWIYSDKRLQSGVTRSQLVEKAADYLRSRFTTLEKARATSEEFIDFCKGRAWIFTDTGSESSGESLYQFTHRTFLEYFTALYLFRTNPTPDDLLRVLLPKITKREWDMVAQLAFHIQSREIEGAGDKLLSALAGFGTGSSPERINAVSFAARCLEFIRTGPEVIRAISAAAFEVYVASRSELQSMPSLPEIRPVEEDPLESLFGHLMRAQLAARETVSETLYSSFVRVLSGAEQVPAAIASEALFRLMTSYRLASLLPRRGYPGAVRPRTIGGEVEEYWRELRDKIVRLCRSRIKDLCVKHSYVARAGYQLGIVDLRAFVHFHGTELIFERTGTSFNDTYYSAVGQPIFYHYVQYEASERIRSLFKDELKELEDIGKVLAEIPPPWANEASFAEHFGAWGIAGRYAEEPPGEFPSFSGNAVFGLFVMAAVSAETLARREGRETALEIIRRLELDHLIPVLGAVSKWLGNNAELDVAAASKSAGLSYSQTVTLMSWAEHQLAFTVPARSDHEAPAKNDRQSESSESGTRDVPT